MKKINWGILGAGKIGITKVIPAMIKGKHSEVSAIASRDINKAKDTAEKLGIPKAYGSYEELLNDAGIDAVYIPLPNHLHVEWTLKALEAGKHVLCEKPISMNYDEAVHLLQEVKKYPGLKVMEAFMYRHHPQWQKVKDLVDGGAIGQLRNIHSVFSYYNINPNDIRNKADIGGGGLMDIGCYNISLSRFLFNSEPERVIGSIDFDPELKTDRLTSGILEFKTGTATFTCSTQMAPYQHVEIYGVTGKIIIDNPFTPGPDVECKITLQQGPDLQEISFNPCDQYTIQGDLFSLAVINNTDVFTPLEDAAANMKVIDSIFESGKSGMWRNIP